MTAAAAARETVATSLRLRGMSRAGLAEYLARQLDGFYPDGAADTRAALARDLDEALDRMRVCVNAVRLWRPDEFDPLHSEQNAHFLWFLANTVWRNRADERLAAKLFYLNKTLNGFTCFYDNNLPDLFLIGHSVGVVLVRADYPERFVVYQNCTVGRDHTGTPRFAEGLVMYPGSAIIGGCRIGPRTVVAQGVSIVHADTPGDCLAVAGPDGLAFKTPKRDALAEYFRL